MFRKSLFILSFLFILNKTVAQPFCYYYDSIPVKINGNYLKNPWAGGLNFIQAGAIDLNLDGIKDLVMFDRSGNKIRTFINNGTANTVDYKYAPQYEKAFPRVHDWAVIVDYNCDNKEDIFTSVIGGFEVYTNTSNAVNGLQFTLFKDTSIFSVYNPNCPPPANTPYNLYVSSVDVPSFTDIDNDGDLDIVTFAITGTFMEYHKNMSEEMGYGCDSLIFEMKSCGWGYAAEGILTNVFTLHDTCTNPCITNPEIQGNNNGDARSANRHSGACELCIDLDGDADKDMIVGGIGFNNLTSLNNGGTIHHANFVSTDAAFPMNLNSTIPVNLTSFPCVYYLDVNNDSIKDLLISPNSPNSSEDFNSVLYYKNVGTTAAPNFQFQQYNLLQDNMIEVGEGAHPVFFDYDNDGLLDLFIGDYGYYDSLAPLASRPKIAVFKNVGTAIHPEFNLITRDYDGYLNDGTSAPFSTLGVKNMVPTFADMDGDGDADLIIGDYNGKVHYFQNIAPTGYTAHFVLSQPNLQNTMHHAIDVGDFAAPQLYDVDGDGKNDLLVGGRNGKILYLHNITPVGVTIPVFDSITNFFGHVNVRKLPSITGYSYPFIFKQGTITKLMVGAESGTLFMYDNIDGNLTGAFNLVDNNYLDIWQGTQTAPTMADINNDGYKDLVVGNYEGGVTFYKGVYGVLPVKELNHSGNWNFDLYPNPANGSFTVRINGDEAGAYKVDIFNVLGQGIMNEKITGNAITLSTSNLKPGIYICKVSEINTDGSLKTNTLMKKLVVR